MMEHEQLHELSPGDARLLDALVENGFERERLEGLSAADRTRVEALMSVFVLMEDDPVEDADDALVAATVLRVRREADVAGRAKRVAGLDGVEATSRGWRIRMPDFISVAAIILIAAAVSWPVIGAIRQKAIDAGCQTNLRALAQGFELYSRDYDGKIPMGTAGYAAGLAFWPDPSVLSELNYCESGHANCPGHQSGGGYSRQVIGKGIEISWATAPGGMPVMGDRNPVIDARASGDPINPFRANSENHSKRGQNVLYTDNAIVWLVDPHIGQQDNIWLIEGQRIFVPGDAPTSLSDAFLVH